MIYRVEELKQADAMAWDDRWRVAMLIDSEYESICGRGDRGAYTIKMSRQQCNWRLKTGDLVGYAEAEKRNVLLVMTAEEWNESARFYQGHTYNERFLRPEEPRVLIHSTPMENWKRIQRAGCLKSWNLATQDGDLLETQPIGHGLLGDPEDFRNYIMFGSGVKCEIVVASKQAGKLVYDENAPYQSGVRLYFDAAKMAEDGLLIRDGNHIKVKDCLALQPYLLWAATREILDLAESVMTPKLFAETADCMFWQKFKGNE